MNEEKEQVIVNMGYDHQQDMYGLTFTFQGQVEFAIPMNLEQIREHIKKLEDLVTWSFVVKRDMECTKSLN